jgi:hypothetical protein
MKDDTTTKQKNEIDHNNYESFTKLMTLYHREGRKRLKNVLRGSSVFLSRTPHAIEQKEKTNGSHCVYLIKRFLCTPSFLNVKFYFFQHSQKK